MERTPVERARNRPLGVSIIAVLVGLQGLVLLLGALVLFVAGPLAGAHAHSVVGGGLVALGVIALLMGLLSFLFAWGLWTLKRWAFWGTVIVQVISILNGLGQVTQPAHANGSVVGNILLPVVILLYFLFDTNVRVAFRT